jgi:hypothetical protein
MPPGRLQRTPPARPLFRRWTAVLFALPVVAGVAETIHGAWVCDDAFISFRYVDQLLRGNGLVYNAGERVEGYTHFLWVVLLAAADRLGLDLVCLGRYLSVAFFVALLAVLLARTWRETRTGAGIVLPIAAWGVALHRDVQVFASGGLETIPFALFVTLGLLTVTGAEARIGAAAAIYALATLLRPEGILYALTAAAYIAWRWRDARRVGHFLAVWAALCLPCLIWRIAYYHSLVPNSFYVKSAGLAAWNQGWHYTRLYFSIYAVLVAGAALAGVVGARTRGAAGPASDGAVGRLALAGAQLLLTVLYVTRVGGDFMFARFYIPITPLVYLMAEEALRRARRPIVQVAGAVGILGLTLYARVPRDRTFPGTQLVHGIVNEANCYPRAAVERKQQQGEMLARLLGGTPVRIATLGGQASVAYFSHLPYVIEGYGLTDREFARQNLRARGRPGHEKAISAEQLRQRGIHFMLLHDVDPVPPGIEAIRLGNINARILNYDLELMRGLQRHPEVQFTDVPAFIDRYTHQAGSLSPEQLVADYAYLHRFYFQHNQDPERLQRLQSALRAAGVQDAALRVAEGLAP